MNCKFELLLLQPSNGICKHVLENWIILEHSIRNWSNLTRKTHWKQYLKCSRLINYPNLIELPERAYYYSLNWWTIPEFPTLLLQSKWDCWDSKCNHLCVAICLNCSLNSTIVYRSYDEETRPRMGRNPACMILQLIAHLRKNLHVSCWRQH